MCEAKRNKITVQETIPLYKFQIIFLIYFASVISFFNPNISGPTKCTHNACANKGVCVQQWNTYVCDCDLTSFTGPTCYDGELIFYN